MKCRYCGTANEPGEVRCVKCDGRLASRGVLSAGAAALAPRTEPDYARSPESGPPSPSPARAPYQASLFPHREPMRVVPIRPPEVRRARPPRPPQPAPAPRYQQQDLAFPAPGDAAASARRRWQEGVVSCDAPVASIMHRLLALAADLALVAIGAALLAATFHLGGGELPSGRLLLLFGGALAVLVWLFYESLWAAAGGDTPGAVWSGLRLTGFDGHRPSPRQRLLRLGIACLGLLAAGMGILWAVFDEEELTWHDQVSNTFLTPR